MSKTGIDITDSSLLEHIAEDLITHHLQGKGLLVAKPKNDRMGADLLVYDRIDDEARFCRVQCKGRTVPAGGLSILIPQKHTTPGYMLFVYLVSKTSEMDDGTLYFFDPTIVVKNWKKNKKGDYILRVPGNFQEKLAHFKFTKKSVDQIRIIIRDAEAQGKLRYFVFGESHVSLPSISAQGTGTHTPPTPE